VLEATDATRHLHAHPNNKQAPKRRVALRRKGTHARLSLGLDLRPQPLFCETALPAPGHEELLRQYR